jgi:NADPH-dependent glutamate synthase beta subunit-like oxidoreductase/coenzyme F420-reducing hydrogenase delta subunit/NAD-dependent dihydropyrimidine dehydrogenase PreA subunit
MANVLPPCQAACPLHQGVRDYLLAIATGDFDRALSIIKESNPLPSICGTICAHHCEDECRRGDVDQALSIRGLKRFAVENGSAKVPPPEGAGKGAKVAVVGGGPSGLTAAYDLARAGCAVTVFDREPFMGGAVRHYIPLYRLPDETVEQDVQEIAAQGVELRPNVELGKDITIADLKKQGYKAILLALGLPVSRGLNLPGLEGEGVYYALSFLKQVKRENFRFTGEPTVIVIGGGNVAMDVARSAVRCGAGQVKLVCLESAPEMPAFEWEIEEAKEEGVEINCSWGPNAILRENGKIVGLEIIECCRVFDDQGRFNPTMNPECKKVITGDLVIFAIGQAGDVEALRSELEVDERGRLVFDPNKMTTSQEGVFACGEVVTGPGTAVQAMANGRLAAQAILSYLEGKAFDRASLEEPVPLEKLDAAVAEKVKKVSRHPLPIMAPEERKQHFQQAEAGFDTVTAICEARRCLTCFAGAMRIDDLCANCLTCVRVCPYGVPVINEEGVVSIRQEQCQACGLCLAICPAYAIKFRAPYVEQAAESMGPAVQELLGRAGDQPRMLAVTCAYGVFAQPELARYRAENLAVVRYPCTAKVDSLHLLKAVEQGVDGIVVFGCGEGGKFECPHGETGYWTRKRVEHARKLLKELGLEEDRVAYVEFEGTDSGAFERVVAEAADKLKALGASPLR